MLYVGVVYENATDGHIFGEEEPGESFTDDPGELYRRMQQEYGRCISKVYVDREGGPVAVGWVFESREKYEGYGYEDTYLRHTWVKVYDEPPKQVQVVEHGVYHVLGGGP